MANQFMTFTAGSVLTADQLNAYLMKQAVIVCDSSADYPASPVEGMLVYDKALDSYLYYTGAAWQNVIQGAAWSTWTPTITQSGSVTRTVTFGRYCRQGRIITAQCLLSVTGAGTGGNNVIVSAPVAAAQAGNMAIGSGYIYDTSAGFNFPGIAVSAASGIAFIPSALNDVGGFLGAAGFTAALASGDSLSVSVAYEAAA